MSMQERSDDTPPTKPHISSIDRTSLVLLGLSAAIFFFALVEGDSTLRSAAHAIWHVPSGVATFCGALLGLLAIALQTRVGFRNLIRSQAHQAELDRSAAAEQAIRDRAAREHQAALERSAREEQRIEDRKQLAAALNGEIISCHRQYTNQTTTWALQAGIYRTMEKEDKNFDFESTPEIKTPVYDANVSKLGLLGPSIASDVSEIIGRLTVRLELTAGTTSAGYMVAILDHLQKDAKEVSADAIFVNKRLLSVQYETADPGALIFERARRKREADLASADGAEPALPRE